MTDISVEFEVVKDVIENEPNTAGDADSVSWMADDESAGMESRLVPVPQTVCLLVTASFDSLADNVAEEDASEQAIPKNLTESNPAGDAGLSDSWLVDAVSAGDSSESVPQYPSSVVISSVACVISLAFISSRYLPVLFFVTSMMEIRCQEIGILTETRKFMSDLWWPPDMILKIKQGKFVG